MTTHSEPPRGERALIRRIALEMADRTAAGAVPFGDDAAGLPVGSPAWVWTTDLLTAGTDFDPGRHAWRQIGRKAMAVNLSDCAAMGCAPRVALCGLVLSDDMTQDDALEIVRGVRACGDEFGCALVGGDTLVGEDEVTSLDEATRAVFKGVPLRGVHAFYSASAREWW
ncbi:MAG TPA: AIR synthase related protein, partial [Phycisphaerae bacterium]|nr:AIR synthase related protein [Phycisphaerae bacterium]